MATKEPTPKLRITRVLAEDELVGPDFLVTRGGGEPEPAVSEEVSRQEDIYFGAVRPAKVDLPDWFRALAKRRAAPEEVLHTLGERLPEIQDLRQAQALLNEVGRLEIAGDVIKRLLTQEIVSKLHRLHQKRG